MSKYDEFRLADEFYSDPENVFERSTAPKLLLGNGSDVTTIRAAYRGIPDSYDLLKLNADDDNGGHWLKIHHGQFHNDRIIDQLRIEVIDFQLHSLGKSALIDLVTVGNGDRVTFGRAKYPVLDKGVSRKHATVEFTSPTTAHGGFITYTDESSTCGTLLFQNTGVSYDDFDERYPTFEDDISKDDQNESAAEAFIREYYKPDGRLSPSEIGVCHTIVSAIQQDIANKPDAKLERVFYRHAHPDKQIFSDPKANHEAFLIIKRAIGLQ